MPPMLMEIEQHVARLYCGSPYDLADPIDAPALIAHRIGPRVVRFDHYLPHDVRIERRAICVHANMKECPEELNYWLARGLAGWDILDQRLPLSPGYADAYARAILLPGPAMALAHARGAILCVADRHCVPAWMVRLRYRDYLALARPAPLTPLRSSQK